MEAIRDTLKSLFEALQKKQEGRGGVDPESLLKKILTKEELRHIKLKCFSRGVLKISVDSSGRQYLLNLKKEGLLKKLQRESTTVKDIRFYLGEG